MYSYSISYIVLILLVIFSELYKSTKRTEQKSVISFLRHQAFFILPMTSYVIPHHSQLKFYQKKNLQSQCTFKTARFMLPISDWLLKYSDC